MRDDTIGAVMFGTKVRKIESAFGE